MLKRGSTVGQHPLISRYLKGVFTKRPPTPRYSYIWDVKLVFDFLRKWSPANKLCLKQLTLKLVMLVALVTAQRSQTIHKLSMDGMTLKESKAVFSIPGLVKQSRPGKVGQTVTLKAYPVDKRLCVVHYLRQYLIATKKHRTKNGVIEQQLFISYKRPHGPISKDTISRWINVVMQHAGIDTSCFKPHSTRAASTSAASTLGVPIAEILDTAGWSNEATFSKYYKKPILLNKDNMAKTLLCKR